MKLQVEVEGTKYDVDVLVVDHSTPAPRAIIPPPAEVVSEASTVPAAQLREPRRRPKLRSSKDDTVCRSPMCGVVISMNVKPGQFVEEDAVVLVLEAMKMETAIRAPQSGHVKTISVRAGDNVVTGQMMVEIADLEAENGSAE